LPNEVLMERLSQWGGLEMLNILLSIDDMVERYEFADSVRDFLNSASSAPSPPVAVLPTGGAGGVAPSLESLMAIFDKLDEDNTGFARRLELVGQVDGLVRGGQPGLQPLLDDLRSSSESFILEREQFQEMVDRWNSSSSSVSSPAAGSPTPEAPPAAQAKEGWKVTKQHLVQAFNKLDSTNAGFISKRELRPKICELRQESGDEEVDTFIASLDALSNFLVDKDQFREDAIAWEKTRS